MFNAIKKMMGCGCESKAAIDKRKEAAVQQDKAVREALSEKQIDKGLKDTMEASDPVTKY